MKTKLVMLITIMILFNALTQAQIPVTNLHSWYKADAGFTFSPSGLWIDQSGNGNNLVPVDFGEPPTLQSDGTNQYLKFATFTSTFPVPQVHNSIMGKKSGLVWPASSTGTTIFMVYKINSMLGLGTAGFEIVRAKTQHVFLQGRSGTTASFTNMNLFNTTVVSDNIYTPSFSKEIGAALFIPNNATGNKLYINGALKAQVSTVGIAADLTATSFRIASLGIPTGSSIDIYEVIVYSEPLASAERQQVESYLATKYSIGIVLPLNLLNLSGQWQNNSIILQWQTENEINTERFEIERSSNGLNFEKVGFVTTKKSTGLNNYSFTDASFVKSDNIFYRLKMIDTDGKFKYSSIVRIGNKRFQQLLVFPNPAKDIITISGMMQNGELRLLDLQGSVLLTQKSTSQSQLLNVSKFAKGVYILQFIGEETSLQQKIIK